MNESRAKARDTVDAVRLEADQEAAAANDKLTAQITAKIEAAEAAIGKSKQKALAEIEGTVQDLTISIVERLTGSKPTATQIKSVFKAGA